MEYGTDQKWGGGRRQETIATDAKNSTPISAVAFALNNTQVVSHHIQALTFSQHIRIPYALLLPYTDD